MKNMYNHQNRVFFLWNHSQISFSYRFWTPVNLMASSISRKKFFLKLRPMVNLTTKKTFFFLEIDDAIRFAGVENLYENEIWEWSHNKKILFWWLYMFFMHYWTLSSDWTVWDIILKFSGKEEKCLTNRISFSKLYGLVGNFWVLMTDICSDIYWPLDQLLTK